MIGQLHRIACAVPIVLYAFAGAAQTVELDPKILTFQKPDQFKWRDPFNKSPSNAVLLHGDGVNGFYVSLTKWNKGGNFSRPHFHDNDRYIMVVSGTWWVDTGGTFDPNRTVPMKAGTFVTHPGREVHYDGARAGSEGAIVMIFGQGPGTRRECEGPTAQTGPGPCAVAKAAAAK